MKKEKKWKKKLKFNKILEKEWKKIYIFTNINI